MSISSDGLLDRGLSQRRSMAVRVGFVVDRVAHVQGLYSHCHSTSAPVFFTPLSMDAVSSW
jgi:hypothetical protein